MATKCRIRGVRLNAYKILIKKPQTRRQLWDYRHVWDSNIKVCIIKVGLK
jgi:hypothetical protein